uniref:Uncharacterized protein n=1 Tax=Candidatus Kentrum sp. MB TaxID=2138164 RepID=A0A451BE77_9GAMM|nr:MAG: hypothetical protein BECKMB1821H_GA0114242_10643 [Candidatus Kentron sp. MB]
MPEMRTGHLPAANALRRLLWLLLYLPSIDLVYASIWKIRACYAIDSMFSLAAKIKYGRPWFQGKNCAKNPFLARLFAYVFCPGSHAPCVVTLFNVSALAYFIVSDR